MAGRFTRRGSGAEKNAARAVCSARGSDAEAPLAGDDDGAGAVVVAGVRAEAARAGRGVQRARSAGERWVYRGVREVSALGAWTVLDAQWAERMRLVLLHWDQVARVTRERG